MCWIACNVNVLGLSPQTAKISRFSYEVSRTHSFKGPFAGVFAKSLRSRSCNVTRLRQLRHQLSERSYGQTFVVIGPKFHEKHVSEVLFCVRHLQVLKKVPYCYHATPKFSFLDSEFYAVFPQSFCFRSWTTNNNNFRETLKDKHKTFPKPQKARVLALGDKSQAPT